MSESQIERSESNVREAIRAGRVRTWADGFGRWHAAVPTSMAFPMGVAKLAIRLECRDRNEADYVDRMPTVEHVETVDGVATYREADNQTRAAESSTCRHCGRTIVLEGADGRWVDPEADGDDAVWRETCDEHDTFEADHEPTVAPEMVKARDLEPGDRIDLEPAFRANPEGDEAQELAGDVHWSIFELTTVERVDTYGGATTIEHDNGVMISVSADMLIPRHS